MVHAIPLFSTFFRSIGGTIALSVMGALMTQAYLSAFQGALTPALTQAVPAQVLTAFHNPQILLSPEAQTQMIQTFAAFSPQGQTLLQGLLDAVKTGLVTGIHTVFILSLIITLIGLVAVFFLKEIELRGGSRKTTRPDAEKKEDEAVTETSLVAAMH